jgi:phage terminase Nu1 subunit (DNA packaging protein)
LNIKDILTLKQIAKILNVTEQTVSSWRKIGMPYVKIGKLVYVIQDSFVKWVKNQEINEKTKNV